MAQLRVPSSVLLCQRHAWGRGVCFAQQGVLRSPTSPPKSGEGLGHPGLRQRAVPSASSSAAAATCSSCVPRKRKRPATQGETGAAMSNRREPTETHRAAPVLSPHCARTCSSSQSVCKSRRRNLQRVPQPRLLDHERQPNALGTESLPNWHPTRRAALPLLMTSRPPVCFITSVFVFQSAARVHIARRGSSPQAGIKQDYIA